MGKIRIVRPGKTRGYPYPVCKKKSVSNGFEWLACPMTMARVLTALLVLSQY